MRGGKLVGCDRHGVAVHLPSMPVASPWQAGLRACAGPTWLLLRRPLLLSSLHPAPLQRITEHKIPLLAMLLPMWLEEKYPQAAAALRANEQRLVSAYDIHTTLHHLLHLGESSAPPSSQYDSWRVAGNVTEAVRWGVSLLDEVPAGRSCDEAGVPPEWCQCFLP